MRCMRRWNALALSAAIIAGLAAPREVCASVAIYGGPTYDVATGTGFAFPQLPLNPGSTAGDGVGAGYAIKYSGGLNLGVRAVRWDTAGWEELGTLGTSSDGYTSSQPYAINAAGFAVGSATRYSGGASLGSRAVRWDGGVNAAVELGNLGADSDGNTSSIAYAVNTAGTAVGLATKYFGGTLLGYRAVRWDAAISGAVELDTLGTDSSGSTSNYAYAVNAAGAAVGSAYKYSGGVNRGYRAVRWDAGGTAATELGNLGTDNLGVTNSYAYCINAGGSVVGHAFKYAGRTSIGYRAVRWDAGGTAATELGNLGTDNSGSTNTSAYVINAAGTAVGFAVKYAGLINVGSRAVRWDAGRTAATELGTLGTDTDGCDGYASSVAYAINAGGGAVGYSRKYSAGVNLGSRAAYWGLDGAVVDLNALLSPADALNWVLTSAASISDTGWITGIGSFDPDGPGPLAAYDRLFLMQYDPPAHCPADFNGVGGVSVQDIFDFLGAYFTGCPSVGVPGGAPPCYGSADFNHQGCVTVQDIFDFLAAYFAGCA